MDIFPYYKILKSQECSRIVLLRTSLLWLSFQSVFASLCTGKSVHRFCHPLTLDFCRSKIVFRSVSATNGVICWLSAPCIGLLSLLVCFFYPFCSTLKWHHCTTLFFSWSLHFTAKPEVSTNSSGLAWRICKNKKMYVQSFHWQWLWPWKIRHSWCLICKVEILMFEIRAS